MKGPKVIWVQARDGLPIRLPPVKEPSLCVSPFPPRPRPGWWIVTQSCFPGSIKVLRGPWRRIWIHHCDTRKHQRSLWLWIAQNREKIREVVFWGMPGSTKAKPLVRWLCTGETDGQSPLDMARVWIHENRRNRNADWKDVPFHEVRRREGFIHPRGAWCHCNPCPPKRSHTDADAYLWIREKLRQLAVLRLNRAAQTGLRRLLLPVERGISHRRFWTALTGEPLTDEEVRVFSRQDGGPPIVVFSIESWRTHATRYTRSHYLPYRTELAIRRMSPQGLVLPLDATAEPLDDERAYQELIDISTARNRPIFVLGLPVTREGYLRLKTLCHMNYMSRQTQPRPWRVKPFPWAPYSDLEVLWMRYMRTGLVPPGGCKDLVERFNRIREAHMKELQANRLAWRCFKHGRVVPGV